MRRNKSKFERDINKYIIVQYGEKLLNYIETQTKFMANWFKFAILRVDFNEYYDDVFHFLNDLKSLKKNDPELRNKKELYKLIDLYLKPSEVEKKGNGEVFTPFTVVERVGGMLSINWKSPYQKIIDGASGIGNFQIFLLDNFMIGLKDYHDDKIDLRNEKVRYKWIFQYIIYTCDISDKNTFFYKNIFDPNDEFDLNHYYGDFLSPGFNNCMKNEWKLDKFDKSIGNPPWNGNIDLKFLTKYYQISDEISIIHPSTWLLDEKNTQKRFTNVKDLIGDHLSKSILINGNALFKNVQLFVPCSITHISKSNKDGITIVDELNNTNIVYDNIYDINKYNSDEYFSLIKKITIKYSLLDKLKHTKENKPLYKDIVNLAQIRGHVSLKDKRVLLLPDFYTLITKVSVISKIPNKHMFFEFETLMAAENFEKYLKTKFVRFCLSILKNNSQLDRGELKNIPWLDFTQEWADEKLRVKYNITDKEWEFIDNVIPDYY